MGRKASLMAASALAAAVAASSASAQTPAPPLVDSPAPAATREPDVNQVQEIVVTARKRAEVLSDVPLTVTALSEEQIEDAGIRSLEDVAAFAPGLNFAKQGNQRGGRSESVVRFRGMDINDVAPTRQLASVFVDGVYVAGGLSSLSFEDVQRVEVIKGPQSAQFGRSTFGGAVNFISKSPANSFSAEAALLLAEGGTIDATATVEGPLGTDRLRGRLTARHYETDGRYRSIADGGRLGAEQTRSVNLILEADPTEALTLRARAFWAEDDDGPPTAFALTRSFHNCGPFFPGGVTYICGELPTVSSNFGVNTELTPVLRDIFVNNSRNSRGIARGPQLDHMGLLRQTQRYSLIADYEISALNATLTSVSSYNKIEQKRLLDLDFTPQAIWVESNFQFIEDWGQEIRLAGETGDFEWMVGGSVFDLHFETPNGSIAYLFPNPLARNGFFLDQAIGVTDVRTYAGFGALTWNFADAWAVSLEGRYQSDRLDQGQVGGVDLQEEFTNFLPRVILQWTPTDETNLYLTYARGNKPGDFNTTVIALTPAQKQQVLDQTGATEIVAEEELDNYEIGLKQSLLDRRLFFTAAAYYMQWSNQQTRTQATVADPTIPAGVRVVPVIISAGRTDLWGAELEMDWRLTDQLSLRGTLNWAESEYKEFLCGFCARVLGTADMAGKSSPRFPDLSGVASLEYARPVAGGLEAFSRVDALYTGSAWDEAFNLARTAPSVRVNLRAGVDAERWRAEIFLLNVFDDDNYLSAARFTDFTKGNFNLNDFVTNVTPAEPRQLGVRLRYRL